MTRLTLALLLTSVALPVLAACGSDEPLVVERAGPAAPAATPAETPAQTPTPTLSAEPTSESTAGGAQSPTPDPAETSSGASAPGPGVPVVSAAPLATPSPLTPSPARGADPKTAIAYELERDTVKTAGVAAKTSTTCASPIDTTKDSTVMCTVDYAGLAVPYEVMIRGGSTIFSYRTSTTKGVLTRAKVLAERGSSGGFASQEDVRCDVPERSLVTLEEPTGATCTYKRNADDELQTQDIVLTDGGSVLFRTRF